MAASIQASLIRLNRGARRSRQQSLTNRRKGGAIFVLGANRRQGAQNRKTTLGLMHGTMAGNGAPEGGGLWADNPADSQDVTVMNNVLSASTQGGNCKLSNISSQYNLSSDGTCGFAGPGDRNNLGPQLGALRDNGGPTLTMLPQPGSPLIDGVSGSDCPATDQRGVARPQGASCDIGAVERMPDDGRYRTLLPLIVH